MCKNAGKTTALNRLIRECGALNDVVAVTSIGRDGEDSDLVTHTKKPGIYIFRGTVIATAAGLLKYCDITKEILCATGIFTPLGEIVLVRAKSDGFVQLAGPSMSSQMEQISALFRQYGAERIFIDGALGRKSLCTRRVCESTILCTGASYHKDISTVVQDTAFICELIGLPQSGFLSGRELPDDVSCKYIPIYDESELAVPKDAQSPEKLWRKGNPNPPGQIFVHGGWTEAMAERLLKSDANLRNRTLIFKDGSRILISSGLYRKLKMRGLSFAVAESIQLLAVTVNPFSAYGYPFDAKEFYGRIKDAVNVPVYDVGETL